MIVSPGVPSVGAEVSLNSGVTFRPVRDVEWVFGYPADPDTGEQMLLEPKEFKEVQVYLGRESRG